MSLFFPSGERDTAFRNHFGYVTDLLLQFLHLLEQLCRLQFALTLVEDIILAIGYRNIFFDLGIASFVIILVFTLAFTSDPWGRG